MATFASIVCLTLVFLACTGHNSHAAVTKKQNQSELVFIGRLEKAHRVYATSDKQRRATTFYFRSQNAAAWATADIDCKDNLGETANLVYLETPEEVAGVTNFLKSSDDTGSTYWLGGKYDPSSSKFVWSNDVELGSWAPWDSNHPDTKLPVTRISAYSGSGALKLRTQFQTTSNRYLCEITA